MKGNEFLSEYNDTIDPITTPKPDQQYTIRECTAHPVFDNQRVREFALLLQYLDQPNLDPKIQDECLILMGELMYQSHRGYSRCGLGSAATDALVEKAYAAGKDSGIYGAKITGGGSGGTVCFLCKGNQGRESVYKIAQQHAAKFSTEPILFSGSSNGARWTHMRKVEI